MPVPRLGKSRRILIALLAMISQSSYAEVDGKYTGHELILKPKAPGAVPITSKYDGELHRIKITLEPGYEAKLTDAMKFSVDNNLWKRRFQIVSE